MSVTAWYGSDHSNQVFLDSFPLHAGDKVTLFVGVNPEVDGGSVSIVNLSTGDSVAAALPTISPSGFLYAKWTIDSYYNLGYNLPDFGTIPFTNALAALNGGPSLGPGDAAATLYDIEYQGQVLTSTQALGETSMQVTYL